MSLVDGLEIEPDLLADHGVIVFARHIDDQGDETVEVIDARQNADAGAFRQIVDLFAEFGQQIRRNLEEVVARIVLERILQHAA